MTNAEFVYLLNMCSLDANTYIRPKDLVCLLSDSDGNTFYDYKNTKVMFDTTNNLIKFKYSILVPASAMLMTSRFTDDTHLVTPCDLRCSPYRNGSDIRFPRAGDYIKLFVKSDMSSEPIAERITQVKYNNYNNSVEFTLETNNLHTVVSLNKSKYIPYLVLGDKGSLVSPLRDSSRVFYEDNVTDKDYDYALSATEHFVGLDFDKNTYTYSRGE